MKDPSQQGRDYEKEVAKDYGGKTTPGSGCHWAAKSDVKTDKYLIEVKYTTTDSYTLHSKDIRNLFSYSFRLNKIPLFQIGFYGGNELVILQYNSIELKEKPITKVEAKGKSKVIRKEQITPAELTIDGLKLLILTKSKFKEYE